MAVKIRLARSGRKKRPFYNIVVTDSRAPRDSKFIEKVGIYNPLTFPETIDINFERVLYWINNGAIPTDTCRSLLKKEGVLYWIHLMKGVKKGALDEEKAKVKFEEWLQENKRKREEIVKRKNKKIIEEEKKKLEAEKIINEKRQQKIQEKLEKQREKEKNESNSEVVE